MKNTLVILFVAFLILSLANSCDKVGKSNICPCDCCDKTVDTSSTLDISFPNFITPNGDGINDKYILSDLPGGTVTLKIYGVSNYSYQSNDYQNDFEGRNSKNEAMPEGKYTVQVTVNGQTLTHFLCIIRRNVESNSCVDNCSGADSDDPLFE